jgi:hypothetical protein
MGWDYIGLGREAQPLCPGHQVHTEWGQMTLIRQVDLTPLG